MEVKIGYGPLFFSTSNIRKICLSVSSSILSLPGFDDYAVDVESVDSYDSADRPTLHLGPRTYPYA